MAAGFVANEIHDPIVMMAPPSSRRRSARNGTPEKRCIFGEQTNNRANSQQR
jgi:hypothetical protein